MRVRLVVCACLGSLVVAAASAATATPPQVLVIGDSVATGMYWHDDAIAVMQDKLGVVWDVRVCRSVDATSCPFEGERPPTLVQAVEARGTVPPIVVVEAGYNDTAANFGAELDHAMSVLTAAGATHVLWLTMRDSRDWYAEMNTLLEQTATRWPELQVLDWNATSAAHTSWFQNDDIHLTEDGGLAMAHLAHGAVMKLIDPLRVPSTPLRLEAGSSYTMKLQVKGGTPPYRWRVASGRPPRGFHLLANGTLTTNGATRARHSFTLAVVDADGTSANLQVIER